MICSPIAEPRKFISRVLLCVRRAQRYRAGDVPRLNGSNGQPTRGRPEPDKSSGLSGRFVYRRVALPRYKYSYPCIAPFYCSLSPACLPLKHDAVPLYPRAPGQRADGPCVRHHGRDREVRARLLDHTSCMPAPNPTMYTLGTAALDGTPDKTCSTV